MKDQNDEDYSYIEEVFKIYPSKESKPILTVIFVIGYLVSIGLLVYLIN